MNSNVFSDSAYGPVILIVYNGVPAQCSMDYKIFITADFCPGFLGEASQTALLLRQFNISSQV